MRFVIALLLVARAFAQTATLRGQVADETGALVPDARITLTSKTGAVRTVQSDSNGAYAFANVTPGEYSISASAPQLAMQPLTVSIDTGVRTLNLQLKIALTTQQVTVQETATTVSTEASNNANSVVLRGSDLDALSDDPEDLAADLQALAGPSAGPSGGSIFIDGFSGGEIPPKSSIREVRINQNPFAAEFDKLGLGKIEIFTKPGADRYHAQIDYNFADDFWNSRNPYAAQKAPLLLNEFEANLSGPINHRTSFTFDLQRNSVDNGAITNGVRLDSSLAPSAFTLVDDIPQRFLRITPRIDYQVNANNTLMLRYSITRSYIDGAGIGSFDLPARGYYFQYTNQTLQVTETAVLGNTVNETRFQYFRAAPQRIANTFAPEIQVLQSFNDGGSQLGRSFDYQNNFELQNNTMMSRGAHAIKFGARLRGQTDDNISPLNFNGTFTFGGGLAPALDANNQPVPGTEPVLISSLERYRRTLLGLPGGGPSQFTISAGNPEIAAHQFDLGVYTADDWRVRPNLTLSLGLRYELQTNIHDWRDISPRIAVAWAPAGSGGNARPKTVIRAGFGIFYERFALSNTVSALRYNGVVEQQYVITNPDFFPNVPSIASLSAFKASQAIREVSATMRAPYILEGAFTVERQLPANTTLAMTYTNSRVVHMFRSNDINAPMPDSGLFPLGKPGPVFLMESSGIYNQNQLVTNINARISPNFSMFGFYVLNKAMSNTDGLNTFPANPYNFAGEYGPASTDVRHRITAGGSINFRWAIRLSPYLIMQSGPPFDITDGSDPYGTTLFNARPGIATDPSKPGLVQTRYGLLDPNPSSGERILSRNFGRGPGQYSLNLRLAKTVGFGPAKEGSKKQTQGPASTGGIANAQAASGGGLRGIIGAPTTDRRFNLIISLSARNVLNHTNPGPIQGNITSPLFGFANQMAGGLNGEGFSENANNRRLELQLRLQF